MKYLKLIIAAISGSIIGTMIMSQLEGNIALKLLICFLSGWALGDMLRVFNHRE